MTAPGRLSLASGNPAAPAHTNRDTARRVVPLFRPYRAQVAAVVGLNVLTSTTFCSTGTWPASGTKETRRVLLCDNDRGRSVPEMTFADRYTWSSEASAWNWHGPSPVAGQHPHPFPGQDTLMFIDVVNAGRVPIHNLNLNEHVPGYIAAPATALDYPWTHFLSGHLGRLATREDIATHQQHIADIGASARDALTTAASKHQVKGPIAGNGRGAFHQPVPAWPGIVNDRSST